MSRPTSWLTSIAPWRPVMLATSMRQPSSPASSQRRTIESSPADEAAAQRRRTEVELGQRAEPEPADVVVGMGVEVVEAASGAAWSARAAANHSWWLPEWLVVRSPTTRMPRAWASSTSVVERRVAAEDRVDVIEGVGVVPVAGARREHRGEVDEVDAERLEVVEVLGHALRGRRGRAGTPPGARRRRTGVSQSASIAQSGVARSGCCDEPVEPRAKRSGKIW